MDVSHHAKLMFQIGHPMTHHSKHVRDEESPFEACRLHQHKETSKKIFNCVLCLIKIEFDCVEFGAITCGAYATRYFKVIVGFIIGNVGIGNWSFDHMFTKFGSKTWSIQYEWTSQGLNGHLRGSIFLE